MSKIENIEYYWELGDDWANSLTHGIGLFLSLVGFLLLIRFPLIEGHHFKLIPFTVYGLSLVILYSVSTFYHGIRNYKIKYKLRLLDHCAIYILIAGTYTPFTLLSLPEFWGIALFVSIWSLALLGIIFKIFFIGRFRLFSTLLYILMGWLVVFAIEPMIASVPEEGLYWLFSGGLFYTGGTLFFALDHIPFYHTIWHLFVMCGSICHYIAIFFYVA